MSAASWRPAANRLVSGLRGVFGERLRSVVAYGSHVEGHDDGPLSCLALVIDLTISDLEACARMSHEWQRDQLSTPLLLPEEEFRSSLDAFPLEYAEMLRTHEPLFGADPFEGIVIDPSDLRRACETQVKSHLVHLREGFVEAGGKPHAVAQLVSASAPAFAAILRHIAQLAAAKRHDRASAAREGARAAKLPDAVVNDILSLERASAVTTTDGAKLFPEYLAAVEQLARFVDAW